jgi:hypothetical protein
MTAFAFPGIETDMVMVTARGNEGRAGTEALHQFEAEHAAVETQRTVEIGDLEVNMADPRSCNDRGILGHGRSVRIAWFNTYVAGKAYASPEVSPSGRPNSNVLSVIETIV